MFKFAPGSSPAVVGDWQKLHKSASLSAEPLRCAGGLISPGILTCYDSSRILVPYVDQVLSAPRRKAVRRCSHLQRNPGNMKGKEIKTLCVMRLGVRIVRRPACSRTRVYLPLHRVLYRAAAALLRVLSRPPMIATARHRAETPHTGKPWARSPWILK